MDMATESLLGRAPKASPLDAWSAFLQRVLVPAASTPSDPRTALWQVEDASPLQGASSNAQVDTADAE